MRKEIKRVEEEKKVLEEQFSSYKTSSCKAIDDLKAENQALRCECQKMNDKLKV